MSINILEMPKLGFGLMRLPTENEKIDHSRVCTMVDEYMKAGLNYFDTAYVYHGGTSEVAARECVVKRYPRDSFYLADKLPAWSMKTAEDRDKIFNEQLERCGVDYFDFYLLHSLEDGSNYDTYERLDCFNWGIQKKAEGKIRRFGFSFHGTPELLEKVLDKHPEIEFVQIQLNYLDWDNPLIQSGKLYDILSSRNIPIIVMEPVKGGTLASLAPEHKEILDSAVPGRSSASWALRFVASLPGVMTILSGMSDEAQMRDNIGTFTDFTPLTDAEKNAIYQVREKILDTPLIGCTSCRYCCDGCPMSISIPDIFTALNTLSRFKEGWRARNFYGSVTSGKGKASDCVACGQCESVCPQHLQIIDLLKTAAEKLESAE